MRTLKICLCLLFACASATSGSAPDAGADVVAGCSNDTECSIGKMCRGGVCVGVEEQTPDAATSPHIIVNPSELDFGAAFLGDEVVLEVTIANLGAPLTISRITIEGAGVTNEFSAMPSGDVQIVLATAGLTTVAVTLLPTDDTEDHGNLVVESNDPENPVVRIPLTSELKGDPEVAVCVLRTGWSDRFNDCETREEVQFDGIAFGDSVTKLVTIWNGGTDNRPLVISDITQTNLIAPFSLALLNAAGGSADYPVLLTAGDDVSDPDFVTLAVTYTATTSLLMTGEAAIASNYENHPEYSIPLQAEAECPSGCSGTVCDLCCTPTVELCDGEDNDCDGVTDNLPELPGFVWCFGEVGVCAGTPIVCTVDGGFECAFSASYGQEVCDGLDNDCNGETDEGDPCIPPPTACVDMSVRGYEGVCRGVDGCEYSITDIPCTAPENGSATCERAACGFECDEGYVVCADGCCRRPWIPTSTENAPAGRIQHTAVWTGSEMVIWGGYHYDFPTRTTTILDDGGRYNPATNTWTPTSIVDAPFGRYGGHTAVWTGSEMIVWGGWDVWGPVTIGTNEGNRYDPASDEWAPIDINDEVVGRSGHTVVWTGSEMIIWGGMNYDVATQAFNLLNNGGRYSPDTDSWTPVSTANSPAPRIGHSTVWTESEMIVWGGCGDDNCTGYLAFLTSGGKYNPVSDTWVETETVGSPTMSSGASVWTSSEMIVWGVPAQDMNLGARYNPASNEWYTLPNENAPRTAALVTGVWTGTEVIVSGGSSNYSNGRYSPTTDTWITVPEALPISINFFHTAVWTGSEMIVWGGDVGVEHDTGGRFTP